MQYSTEYGLIFPDPDQTNLQYSTVQHSTVQYCTMQYIIVKGGLLKINSFNMALLAKCFPDTRNIQYLP